MFEVFHVKEEGRTLALSAPLTKPRKSDPLHYAKCKQRLSMTVRQNKKIISTAHLSKRHLGSVVEPESFCATD